jgi:hypothetical protein
MVKKRNWLVVIVSCIFLLVIPTASAEIEFSGDQTFGEHDGDVDDSWAWSDIEKLLNVYGPTSAGNTSNNTSNKTENKLLYEEMGVYGVEYENIFVDQYSKESAPIRQSIDTKSDNSELDKAPNK